MAASSPDSSRFRRWLEFVGFFWIVPILVAALPSGFLPPIPVLWAAAIACLLLLRRDDRLDRRTLWGAASMAAGIPGVIGRFLIFAPLLAGFAWLMEPEWFLKFPRDRTGAWAAVMVLYPLLSVVPQGIVFRTFVCHRYRSLFGNGVTIEYSPKFNCPTEPKDTTMCSQTCALIELSQCNKC